MQLINQMIAKKKGDKTKMRIDRIKFAAELMRQDMTQKALAEKSGVSRVTITGIKSGRSCSDETGEKLAAALNVPIKKLLED